MSDDKLTAERLSTLGTAALARMALMQSTLLDAHKTFSQRRQEGMEARLRNAPESANPYPEEGWGGGWQRGWGEMDNLLRAQAAEKRLAKAEAILRRLVDAAGPISGGLSTALVGEPGPLLIEFQAATDAAAEFMKSEPGAADAGTKDIPEARRGR